MKKIDAKEMGNIVYDTLMSNTNYPQFNVDEVIDCDIDNIANEIHFDYQGKEYTLIIKEV